MTNKLPCYYALGGINYKNGFVTTCPQTAAQLHIDDHLSVPSQFINNENFKKYRLELMSGEWPSDCHLCKEVEEASAGKSMRLDYPADESFYNPHTGAVDFKSIRHIELRFSNSCNMACLHCSDVYSSGWMSKLKRYVPDEEDRFFKLQQLTKEMHRRSKDENLSIDISLEEMERIVDDLNANFPLIEKIDFAGGEVLYQKQFFPCLTKLAAHPNAKNIEITFHSNFNTKFNPEELSRLLTPFKASIIHISVDAGRRIYPYFRTGDWDVLTKNIKTFRSVNDFTSVVAVCTTSVYQIMEIEDMFESLLTLDFDWIDSSIVYTPRYLNPSVMMLEFKDHVLRDIENTYKLIESINRTRFENLEKYKNLRSWQEYEKCFNDLVGAKYALKNIEDYVLNHTGATPFQYDGLLAYIRKTDAIWGHNFNDYVQNYKYIDGKLKRIKHD